MAASKKARPRAGGPDSPEANRAAKVVSVRLDAAAREALDRVAARWKISRSAAVARLALEAVVR